MNTGSAIEPQSALFWLFLRHFQALPSPQSFDPLVIHLPSPTSQQFRHPTIAVPPTELSPIPDMIRPTENGADDDVLIGTDAVPTRTPFWNLTVRQPRFDGGSEYDRKRTL